MPRRIAIIQGHPDPSGNRFAHALAQAYAHSATTAGHEVKFIDVARLDFPLLRTKVDFETGAAPPTMVDAQTTIRWTDHLVIIFPLWLGTLPALLKAFLEHALRPGFAFAYATDGKSLPKRLLSGKSTRKVVSMGMPAFIYRWYFGAHGVKSLQRSILSFCGIGPIKSSLIGMVETADGRGREKWLAKMRAHGATGD